ncbi:MlaA family lipoprotein [Caulobacter soli]|uniref:MlaA family lipoprotein n=1 Tax=Caulobacter soli TaxID=2708539 RepID=UPI001FEADC53|nr:VacJ family lipoprotein [Caulobacter soli]
MKILRKNQHLSANLRTMTAALALLVAGGVSATASSAHAQTVTETPIPLVAAPDAAADVAQTAYDPLEGFNRGSFALSMGVDRAVLRPLSHGYVAVTPTPLRHRVSAVVYNLGEPSTVLNDVLQGKPKRAGRSSARFVINSTIGVLGLFDVASGMGIRAHDADFGQTFGRYGVKAGPYLYVPVIGPSNFRDGVGRVFDFFTDPVGIAGGGWRTTFGATRLVVQTIDTRTNADGAFRALDDSVDPYITARSAYGQHREAFVREATGEVQALPDFDDVTSSSEPAAAPPSDTPPAPSEPAPSTPQ